MSRPLGEHSSAQGHFDMWSWYSNHRHFDHWTTRSINWVTAALICIVSANKSFLVVRDELKRGIKVLVFQHLDYVSIITISLLRIGRAFTYKDWQYNWEEWFKKHKLRSNSYCHCGALMRKFRYTSKLNDVTVRLRLPQLKCFISPLKVKVLHIQYLCYSYAMNAQAATGSKLYAAEPVYVFHMSSGCTKVKQFREMES